MRLRLASAVLACAFPVAAQEVRASLTGFVSDPSGSPVSGAGITVTNVAQNTSVTTKNY